MSSSRRINNVTERYSRSTVIRKLSKSCRQLISNEPNWEPGQHCKRGTSASIEERISRLNANDTGTPNRLRRLLEAIETVYAEIAFDDLMACHDAEVAVATGGGHGGLEEPRGRSSGGFISTNMPTRG